MQSQMIGMQSSLDRILMAVSQNQAMTPYNSGPRDPSAPSIRNGGEMYSSPGTSDNRGGRPFPPLPGFAPPVSL